MTTSGGNGQVSPLKRTGTVVSFQRSGTGVLGVKTGLGSSKTINSGTSLNYQRILQSHDNEVQVVQQIKISDSMNCIILLEGGKLYIEDCLLSMNFILKGFQEIITGIVLNSNQSELIINRCEIKGNKECETIGIVSKKANGIIKDCKIHNHIGGGVLIWTEQDNFFKIINNRILYNSKVGVSCSGADSAVQIETNEVKNNYGFGIQVGIANRSQIISNEINENYGGIEVISGDPYIKGNIIEKNEGFGIYTRSYDGIRCDGKILKNLSISQNREYGIVCSGEKNYTIIEKKLNDILQQKSWNQIEDNAQVFIFANQIQKNLGQGILLVESSSAVIEKNGVHENIKANIALGGFNSQNTLIVDNIISGGRCEGIFIINCCEAWILRNTIEKNNDGIIAITSVPLIQNNIIQNNKSHGIMLLKDSRPKLIQNKIISNDSVGVYIRQIKWVDIKEYNQGQPYLNSLRKQNHLLLEDIQSNNEVKGEVRVPSNYICSIF